MANRKHLAVLRQGVATWNKWREREGLHAVFPNLRRVKLRGFDLTGADLRGVQLGGADLSEANLSTADLRGVRLGGTDLSWAKLHGTYLHEANLRGATFTGADLRGVNLCDMNLSNTNFRGADLSGADLRQANLSGASLHDAKLVGANLSGAKLIGTKLVGAKLVDAKLIGANLIDAKFAEADLSRASLAGANLVGTNLTKSILAGADLRGANLSGKNLRGADLSGADLRGVAAHGTILDGAVLTDVKLWETLRAEWSIKGVSCERMFWDKEGVEPTEYAPGEFEKLYSEQQVIQLIYKGGITRFELNTLPALLYRLSTAGEGCSLRLKSVEEVGGGTEVSIVVEDVGTSSFETLAEQAVQLQEAQLALRGETKYRERLEIEKALLLDEVFPRMLSALAPKQITATASAGSTIVLESTHVEARSYQAIKDLGAVKSLVNEIFGQRMELGLPNAQLTRLEEAIQAMREELRAGQPETSVLREGLNTIRNVLEGAVGSALAAAAREHWSEILQTLSQLLQRLQ